MPRNKRTKILATVGPASNDVKTLEKMILAGANVFRLNFSHGSYEDHAENIRKIREASKNVNTEVGILQDICGPKVRVGTLKENFSLSIGDEIKFFKKETIGQKRTNGKYELSINQPHILELLKKDDTIYLADGSIRVTVKKIEDDHVSVTVQNNALLSSNKGVNFPNTVININVITQKDEADLRWGAKHDVDYVAISFVQKASDVQQARKILNEEKSDSKIISKIEKFDAVEKIDEILDASDGLMIARGDLGIEVPYYRVPNIQKELIEKANAKAKPVITATQMLLSMTTNDMATRAEISDVANAVLDGTDAVMLSEESAVGKHPAKVIEVMASTIIETEKRYPYSKFDQFPLLSDTDITTEAVAKLSQHWDLDGIVVLTKSGSSARNLSRYRTNDQIYAVTHSQKAARQLTLSWGIKSGYVIEQKGLGSITRDIIKVGLQSGIITKQRKIIIIGGHPVGVKGSTNFIRIFDREQIEYYED